MTMQELIKEIMKEMGVRQIDLAKHLGMSRQLLSQILKGDDMKISTAETILNALGFTLTARRIPDDE